MHMLVRAFAFRISHLNVVFPDEWCILHQVIGEKLSEIGGRLDYPCLTMELAHEIEALWNDTAIQVLLPLLFISCNWGAHMSALPWF